MTSPAHNSDRTLTEARSSLVRQQAGGRRVRSIGKRSAAIRRQHLKGKIKRICLAVGAIIFAALVAGLIFDGIGFAGVMLTFLTLVGAVMLFGTFPRLKVPERAALNRGSAKALVGNTELWLEAQRPALPRPAAKIVDRLGVQLDALGVQLEGSDEKQPAIAEVRKLVGEHLPGVVSAYTSIPSHLRSETRAGRTPDDQLADSLARISQEIDSVTRQLAEGHIDKLAIQTRFLDYKYGDGVEEQR